MAKFEEFLSTTFLWLEIYQQKVLLVIWHFATERKEFFFLCFFFTKLLFIILISNNVSKLTELKEIDCNNNIVEFSIFLTFNTKQKFNFFLEKK